jgi:hypothetical protein
MIDTEKESALTYADDFTFDHLPWDPPFEPRELAQRRWWRRAVPTR